MSLLLTYLLRDRQNNEICKLLFHSSLIYLLTSYFEGQQDGTRMIRSDRVQGDLRSVSLGFYPDPELPRINALNLAMETDATSCTNRINLFGPKLADNPSGIICAMPVWKTDDGKVHPSKPQGASHDDCFGFVVPVIVGRLLLNNIFEADAFGRNIEDIVVYAYDVGDDAGDNFITTIDGEVIDSTVSWFIGRYPQPQHVEEEDGTVISREVDEITQRVEADEISRNGFAEIRSKTMKIGERDWKIDLLWSSGQIYFQKEIEFAVCHCCYIYWSECNVEPVSYSAEEMYGPDTGYYDETELKGSVYVGFCVMLPFISLCI